MMELLVQQVERLLTLDGEAVLVQTIAGTQEVYSGITAGSVYTHRGNGANHLSLVKGQLHA